MVGPLGWQPFCQSKIRDLSHTQDQSPTLGHSLSTKMGHLYALMTESMECPVGTGSEFVRTKTISRKDRNILLTWGSKSAVKRMLEDLMSLWIILL